MMLSADGTALVHARRLDHDFCPAVPKTPRKKPHHSSVFIVKRNSRGVLTIGALCAFLFLWAKAPHPRASSAHYETKLSLHLTVPTVCRTQRLPAAHQKRIRPQCLQTGRALPMRPGHAH